MPGFTDLPFYSEIEKMRHSGLCEEQTPYERWAKEANDEFFEESPSETVLDYYTIASEIAGTVIEKQAAYGDSFGRAGNCLREMYPDGIRPEQYDDLLTIARVIDKLFRVASDKGAFGESPFRDICGYALLEVAKNGRKKAIEPPV